MIHPGLIHSRTLRRSIPLTWYRLRVESAALCSNLSAFTLALSALVPSLSTKCLCDSSLSTFHIWYPLLWHQLSLNLNHRQYQVIVAAGTVSELCLKKLREVITKLPDLESLLCRAREVFPVLTSPLWRQSTLDRTVSPLKRLYSFFLFLC